MSDSAPPIIRRSVRRVERLRGGEAGASTRINRPGGTVAGTPIEGWSDKGSLVEIDAKEKGTIRILVVDDERTIRESCSSILQTDGFPVTVTGRADEALNHLRHLKPHIVLVDLFMPDISGMDILAAALEHNPDCLVVMMTGKPSVESSIQALRSGAWNYIPKPFSATHLNILMGRAAHAIVIARESRKQKKSGKATAETSTIELLGVSDGFMRVLEAARQVAATDASVFLSGESGTGKEMIAQFIHQNSKRSSREMVAVNSAALPETLLESEMFGHVEGAFTGAVRDKTGLLEAANGGTLFLDEIHEMPHSVQAKLLRVVQDGVVRRLGSVGVDAVVDVRFIAATNHDPGDAVREGKLRKDLHYRLRVFPIEIPPLRERPEDIPILARHYLEHFWNLHRVADGDAPEIGEDAMAALRRRPWYGNIRELRNVMEHTVVILPAKSKSVKPDVIPFQVHEIDGGGNGASVAGTFPLHEDYHTAREHVLTNFEQTYLKHVVRQAGGNLSDAARIAGIDRTTLYRLLEKHEIRREFLLKSEST